MRSGNVITITADFLYTAEKKCPGPFGADCKQTNMRNCAYYDCVYNSHEEQAWTSVEARIAKQRHRMQKMAFLRAQTFKISRGSMPPDPYGGFKGT